ncbi:MAG: hypothetical protein H6741_25005 [Alphaproteobacteria bacterium]|nr:hypothetical protein [Alphaproteobacteria bacterium]MCB9795968.1 hypothetical protein [Alphaproteobacteria bacterium]
MSHRRLLPLAATLAWLLPASALAKDVAISPFVAAGGTDEKVVNNVTAIVSSEVEFMSDFEWAEQLSDMPTGMNAACLAKSSCLKAVGKAAGREMLIAGKVTPGGGEAYEIYVVYFDVNAGTKVRDVTFTANQSTFPDQIGPEVRGMVAGGAAVADAEDEGMSADDFGMFEDDDQGFLPTIDTPGNSRNTLDDFEAVDPEEERRAEEARRREDAERRAREDAERRAREDAERRAREEAARRAESDARAREEQARLDREAEDDDFDLDDISFSTAVGDTSGDDYDARDDDRYSSSSSDRYSSSSGDRYSSSRDDDRYSSSSSSSRDDRSSSSSRDSSSSSRDRYDLDEDEYDDRRYSDLDEDEYDERRSRDSSAEIRGTVNDDKPAMGITFRAGGSKMQSLNFVTYGVELSIPVASSVFLSVGLDGYSTKRDVPPALQEEFGPVVWNTITPLSFGVIGQRTSSNARPYIGGDITLTPYTSNFKTAPGARVRGGVDLMVSEGFGFNIDLAAGVWYGKEFNLVQADLQPVGPLVDGSVGTVIRF